MCVCKVFIDLLGIYFDINVYIYNVYIHFLVQIAMVILLATQFKYSISN